VRLEEFASGDSFVHNLDPRAKILAVAVFSIVVALTHSIAAAAISVAFPLVLISVARIPFIRIATRLALVNAFVVFLWCTLPFTSGGAVVWSFGPLNVHAEGLRQALLITLKSNAVVLTVMALLGTSSVFTLVHALSHLGVPMKLVHLFFFCFRYVHVIQDEYTRLRNAAKIRGFNPSTNLHTYRTYAFLVGMILVRSFDRSKRIMAAMKCRGFKGSFYILHDYRMKRYDYVITASSFAFSAALLVVR
jgi:cobalt/nickel transport system permease protein